MHGPTQGRDKWTEGFTVKRGGGNDGGGDGLVQAQALLLHLEHALDDQGGSDGRQDEAQGEGEGDRHAKQGGGQPPIEEGLADARDDQQADGGGAHPLEDLHARG